MSNIPNKHVQAYHLRQAYVEVLKHGYVISVDHKKDNVYLISVTSPALPTSPTIHKFILRPDDDS